MELLQVICLQELVQNCKVENCSMKPLKVVICDSWWLEEEDYKEDLKKTLEELNVSFPLYQHNKESTIRFNFEELSPMETCNSAVDILSRIFLGKDFLYCCYGEIGIPFKRLKRYTTQKNHRINCIEGYLFDDSDYFEFCHNNISYVHVLPDTFRFYNFAKDISCSKGDANYQLLISVKDKIAVHFYDCRGLDVVSSDNNFICELKDTFKNIPIWNG